MKTPEQEFFERLRSMEALKPTAPSEGSSMELQLAQEDRDSSAPVTLRNLFTHHDAHPMVLDVALLKAFGTKWIVWENETLWQEIPNVFKTAISEHCRAKIMAMKSLHVTETPWTCWQVFEKIAQALNNNIPRADIVQAPSVEQLFVAVDTMSGVRTEQFSHEVKAYIAAALLHDNIVFAPPPLDFAQVELSEPRYECLDCGNVDSALFHDGYCDTCTQKFDSASTLAMRPDPEAVAAGKGRNLKLTLKYDPDPVQKRWLEVERLPTAKVEFSETQEDIQVAKLLVARDYMNIRRRQLAEQLTSLKAWLGAQ